MAVGTALTIGSILAKLGEGYFANRDARSTQREQDRRVGYSNLINAFGGRSTPSRVEPKRGTATTILGGLGTALGTGASIYDMLDANKLRDLQMANVQAQMDSRTQADDIIRGATMGAGSTLPQTSISTAAPKLAVAAPPPVMPVASKLAGAAPSAEVMSVAPKLAGLDPQSALTEAEIAAPPPVMPKLAGAAPPPVMPKLAGAAPPPMSAEDLSTLSSMPSETFPASKLAAMPSELFPASREANTLAALGSMPSELFPDTKLAAMPSELFPASREAEIDPNSALRAAEQRLAAMPIAPISDLSPVSRGATPPSDLTGPSGAGSRMAPGSFELGGSVAPGDLSDVGQAAFRAAQNERIAARGAAQGAAQQQAFENNKVLSDQFLRAEDLSLKARIFEDKLTNLGKLTTKDRLAAENTLRKDFNRLTSEFRDVGNSFNTILAGAENPTAVSDMSLIFSFMKMLDPGSVVRESEFDQAESAAGWSDSALNAMNKFWDGTKLTTNRGEFLSQAKNLYDARMPGYTNIVDTYTGIAGRENLNAQNIVMEYGVNLDRFDEILKKSQGQTQTTTGSGHTHGDVLSFLETYEPGRMKPGQGVLLPEYQ